MDTIVSTRSVRNPIVCLTAPWGPNDHVEYGNTISAGRKGTGVWQTRGNHLQRSACMPNELVGALGESQYGGIYKEIQAWVQDSNVWGAYDRWIAVLAWHDVKTNEYHWYSFHNHRDTFSNANGRDFTCNAVRKTGQELNLKTSLLVRIHNTRTFTSANGLHFQITSLTPRSCNRDDTFFREACTFLLQKCLHQKKSSLLSPTDGKNNYLPFTSCRILR